MAIGCKKGNQLSISITRSSVHPMSSCCYDIGYTDNQLSNMGKTGGSTDKQYRETMVVLRLHFVDFIYI